MIAFAGLPQSSPLSYFECLATVHVANGLIHAEDDLGGRQGAGRIGIAVLDPQDSSGKYSARIVQDPPGNGEEFRRGCIGFYFESLPGRFRGEPQNGGDEECNRAGGAHLEPHSPEGRALTGAAGVYFKSRGTSVTDVTRQV